MAEHPIQGLMNVTMEKIHQMVDSNTIIGKPITTEDGITILRRLRAAPDTAKFPVILLTANITEYDMVVGLDTGADDYIP